MKSFLCYDVVTESQKPYLAMLFIQFVYAGMALFSKAAIAKGMNPYVFVVYRQAFASLALAPFAFFLERLPLYSSSIINFLLPIDQINSCYITTGAINVQKEGCSLILQLAMQNLLHFTLWVCTWLINANV